MNRTIGTGPKDFAHLAQQVFDVPLAILPHKAEVITCALQQRLGIASFDTINGVTLDAKAMLDRAALASDATRPYDSRRTFHVDGSIAVIPMVGTLVHRFGWLDPISGMTGYDGLSRKLRDAMADPDIHGIWLDIDSPGGTVAGLNAFVDQLAMSTVSEGGKPIYAYVNEMACSAAYAVASVCDRVYGPADADVGSIGTLAIHYEMTGALSENGIQVTIMRSGERKARGGPYEELDPEFFAKMQASLDRSRDEFARRVAMGRSMEFDAVMATEADWFEGEEAVELGLMDDVLSEAQAWELLEEAADQHKRQKRNT